MKNDVKDFILTVLMCLLQIAVIITGAYLHIPLGFMIMMVFVCVIFYLAGAAFSKGTRQ